MSEFEFKPEDHAIFTGKNRLIHVLVRHIANGAIYLKNYTSDKLYCASADQIQPFSIELAEEIGNRKTAAFCQLVREGKMIRTAGEEWVWKDGHLVVMEAEEPAVESGTTLNFTIPPFIYNPEVAPVKPVEHFETEFNYQQAGCFGAYGTLCNNRTQVAMNCKQAQQFLEVKKEVGSAQSELGSMKDLITEDLKHYFRLMILGSCTSQPFATIIDAFTHYVSSAFFEDELATILLLKQEVCSRQIEEKETTLKDYFLYCESCDATVMTQAHRCMMVVFSDWLEQNITEYTFMQS